MFEIIFKTRRLSLSTNMIEKIANLNGLSNCLINCLILDFSNK